jgi:FKBP-type peptidyl-prolyl cis-trans isomerase FkpA
MLNRIYFLAIVALTLLIMPACSKEDPEAIAKNDRKKILEYIEKNNLQDVAIEDPSGLYYIVEDPGNGVHPTLTSLVRVKYEGYYIDGQLFDKSDGALFQLQGTIEGWRIGIPLFKNNGKGKLLVPSALGYGPYPPWGSGIKRNAVLVFDFLIMDVAK